MLPPCDNAQDTAAAELWARAEGDESVAWLLELPVAHPAGRILLVHHEELFPTIRPSVDGAPERITAEYFVWNSHTIEKQEHALAQVRLDSQRTAVDDVNALIDKMTSIVEDSARDSIVLAGLRSVQENEIFQRLVNEPDGVQFWNLKKEARDYRDIDWTGATNALKDSWDKIVSGSRSRAIINAAAINMHMFIDMLFHITDGCQLGLLSFLLRHQRELLTRLSIPEERYRGLVLQLNQTEMLRPSGPAVAICSHCPGGCVTRLHTAVLGRAIRCPICGHRTKVMAMLRPTNALADALHLRDGFIGGWLGWLLKQRDTPFRHPYYFSDGTEIDFLVQTAAGVAAVECKTHKRGGNLREEFAGDRDQLYDRLDRLRATGIEATEGIGVSNVTAEELRPFRDCGQRPQASCQTRLLSFEEVPAWLDQCTAKG